MNITRTCKVGLHGRNDLGFVQLDHQIISGAKIEVLKMMSQTNPTVFSQIKTAYPTLEFITRLYDDRIGRNHYPSPTEFVARFEPILSSLKPYCQKFEIHNEPNHRDGIEGWGSSEAKAQDFKTWFLAVYAGLKQAHPWASLGFPGLAVPDAAHGDQTWLRVCRPAINTADWLGVHSYWQSPPNQPSVMLNDMFGLNFHYYHAAYPHKVLEITECGNANGQGGYPLSDADMAWQYQTWLNEVFKQPYINSVAFFILSSPDPNWDDFAFWTTGGHTRQEVVNGLGQQHRPTLVSIDLDGLVSNQTMLNAFHKASRSLGLGDWGLIHQTSDVSIEALAADREGYYIGPKIETLSGLSEADKIILQQALNGLTGRIVLAEPGQTPPQPTQAAVTNQQMIDAFYMASLRLGRGAWSLMSKAGISLDSLAANRQGAYVGAPIDDMDNLNEQEKRILGQKLTALLKQ